MSPEQTRWDGPWSQYQLCQVLPGPQCPRLHFGDTDTSSVRVREGKDTKRCVQGLAYNRCLINGRHHQLSLQMMPFSSIVCSSQGLVCLSEFFPEEMFPSVPRGTLSDAPQPTAGRRREEQRASPDGKSNHHHVETEENSQGSPVAAPAPLTHPLPLSPRGDSR